LYEILGIDFPPEYILSDDREVLENLPPSFSKFYDRGDEVVVPIGKHPPAFVNLLLVYTTLI
jgi:hypothetical protein